MKTRVTPPIENGYMMNYECERRLLTRSSRLSCTLMAALFAAVVGIGGGAVSVLHADDSDIVITER